MNEMEIKQDLDKIMELRAYRDTLNLHYDQLRDDIIPPEIQEQLDDIEAACKTEVNITSNNLTLMEAEIKQSIRQLAKTVHGEFLMAMYSKPRITWDSKGLAGYAVAHPEIEAFKKYGNASVSIRVRKGK